MSTNGIKIGSKNILIAFDPKDPNFWDLMNNIIEVNNLHKFINEQPIFPEWREEIQRMEFARAIHGTLAIEGSDLNLEEVEKIIESPILSAEQAFYKRDKEASNVLRAYEFIQEWSKNNPDGDITEAVIRQIHTIITRDIDYGPNKPGQYRNHIVTFGIPRTQSELKSESEIQDAMSDLIEFINSKERDTFSLKSFPISRALVAHHLITIIHPFSDGNGRVARAIEALILHHYGKFEPYCFPISAKFYYREREKYFVLLKQVDITGDPTPFIDFAVKGFLDYFKEIKKSLLEKITYSLIIDYMHHLRRTGRILKRHVNIMEILFKLGEIEFSKFWDDPSIGGLYYRLSDSTKRRDVRQLENFYLVKIRKAKTKEGKEIAYISPNWDVLKNVTLRLDKIPHRPD